METGAANESLRQTFDRSHEDETLALQRIGSRSQEALDFRAVNSKGQSAFSSPSSRDVSGSITTTGDTICSVMTGRTGIRARMSRIRLL